MGTGTRPYAPGAFSRRRLLGGALCVGGGLLLAACGGGATMPSATPNTAVPAAPVATTASTVATAPVAATARGPTATNPPATRTIGVGNTATRAVTPGVIGATPGGGPADNAFGRMLALMPQIAPLPGPEGISFADLERQKRNYGWAGATSAQAFGALGVDTARLNNLFAALPLPRETGVSQERNPQWRATFGYDFWQIERTIAVGSPPGTWTRLEGRFDRAAIATALAAAGHQPVAYGGATILSRGGDAQLLNLDQPFTRLTLSALNRVVLDANSLTATPYTALAQAGIDAGAGRTPSFAADPEYAALVAALGPVVGARLLPAEGFYRATVPNPRVTPALATASATRSVDPNRPTLRPYRLVGLGLRDDGQTHTMVIALLYANAAEASADAPLLRQRATDYVLFSNGQPLRERAVAGEPEITPAGRGATLVLPLAIAQEANLGLWERMLAQRDYAFLAA